MVDNLRTLIRRGVMSSVSIGAIATAALAASAGMASADVVSTWNGHVVTIGGPAIQRTLAMVHIAMFDAVNAVEPRYTPYLRLPAPAAGTSAEAAAAGAAHGVLVRLFPNQAVLLGTALANSLAGVPDGPGKTSGVVYGDIVASLIYDARLADNILAPGPIFVPGSSPGDYQLTTSTPPQPVNTNAPNWIPFALRSASQFRPNGPAALSSVRYARDLDEVQRLGGAVSAERTMEQEESGRWHTEMAQFQFNRIARSETANDGRDLLEHARLFALLNIAMADAVTSVFDAKYSFAFWRPVTAIRNADIDGNDRTIADPAWAPFLPTPPHPEYPAAHAVVQRAGARVMKAYFGPHHAFATTSPTVAGIVRSYEDFDAFADEGSMARIIGGMHFRSSLDEGGRQGTQVANWVLSRVMLPLD
jgi:hypothetical protein